MKNNEDKINISVILTNTCNIHSYHSLVLFVYKLILIIFLIFFPHISLQFPKNIMIIAIYINLNAILDFLYLARSLQTLDFNPKWYKIILSK